MSRLLFLLAVIAVVYLLIRSYRKTPPDPQPSAASEDMVRCAHCGVHLPRSEAIQAEGKFFCSQDHQQARQS
ncbi:MAG: hypothetical protein Fur0040_01280 [Sideroxydans sp.]